MFKNTRSATKRTGAVVTMLGLVLTGAAVLAGPATAAEPTITPANGSCEGVKTTPGSENTDKKLTGGTLAPGGTAEFDISYPVDADDVGKTFTITDCVFVSGDQYQKYEISFVPNNTAYHLSYALDIPADAPLGEEYCNYAKTTASPSTSQASNRKAGPACFTIAGDITIEKRAESETGDLLPGATFDVDCSPTSEAPPLQVVGLDEEGVSADGTISIAGPEGTECTVTETAAPDGYELADPVTFTIPRGTAAETIVMVDPVTAGCPEGQVDDGDGGCVTPTEEPSEEPSEEPTDEPTVEPDDPTPTVSPTVLGVKIVKPAQLPTTGSPTGLLLALGLGLTVAGAGVVYGSTKHQRQH
jgi:uncharacterized surface anchored protein